MKPDATPSLGTKAFMRGVVGVDRTDEDQLAALYLKTRIERLSDLPPMWSRSAYTHRRTVHVAFASGAVKREGDPMPEGTDVLELAQATYDAVRAYHAEIVGPANAGDFQPEVGLVWRCEPEVRRDGEKVSIYCRLCFESLAMADAA